MRRVPGLAIGAPPDSKGSPDACASRWRTVEAGGPAGSWSSIVPSSSATRQANAVSSLGTDAQRKTCSRGPCEPSSTPARVVAALAEVGAGPEHVVRTRVFLVRAEDADDVARAHGEVFREVQPASTMVVAGALLDPRWLVELEVDAVVPEEAGQ